MNGHRRKIPWAKPLETPVTWTNKTKIKLQPDELFTGQNTHRKNVRLITYWTKHSLDNLLTGNKTSQITTKHNQQQLVLLSQNLLKLRNVPLCKLTATLLDNAPSCSDGRLHCLCHCDLLESLVILLTAQKSSLEISGLWRLICRLPNCSQQPMARAINKVYGYPG